MRATFFPLCIPFYFLYALCLFPLICEVAPDIQKEVKGELQQLDTHDDGYTQVQAQGSAETRHQAWWLKINNYM